MYRSFVRRAAIVMTCSALAVGSSACFGFENIFSTPTSPSNSSPRSYIGTWSSQSVSSFPTPTSCGNLKWNVTSQQGTQIAGDFEATCAGGITLKGTATGTAADSIVWAASGNAIQGAMTCPFTMNGTGTFQGTSTILVSYAGTTCVGPISGTEPIKR